MVVLNIIFLIVFITFAWFNLDDEDAWLWVSIYGFTAICSGAAVFGYYLPIVYLVAIAFFLMYAVILFFAKDGVKDWITKYNAQSIAASMQADKPWIEKTREFFGLLIAAGALLINYLVSG